MSLREQAYRARKWRGMEILPILLEGKSIEAERYLSSAKYHPIEGFADLIRIALLTAENIKSFPLELDEEEAWRLGHELEIICKSLGNASDYIDKLISDINHQSGEWKKGWWKKARTDN